MAADPPRSARSGRAAWRRRWQPAHEADLRDQLTTQARDPRPPHRLTSPWGSTVEGAVDLRGLVPRAMLPFRYLSLQRLDLSGSAGHVALIESEFTDCVLDGVTLLEGTSAGRRFERCSFRAATLRRVHLGRLFLDCDLTGAKLRAASTWPATRFERCVLDGADLTDATLTGATFVDCSFTGLVTSSLTTFTRCVFEGAVPAPGEARVTSSHHDGVPLPDRWDGAAAAAAHTERYLARYVAAAEAGDADDLPLSPGS